MARREASRWKVAVILAAVVVTSCGGETTGVARHVDVGRDASVPGVDAASSPSCPASKPTSGHACNGSPTYLGSTCSYGSETCRCMNMGQDGASWVCRSENMGAGGTGATGTGGRTAPGGTTAAGGVAGSGGSLAPGCCQKDFDCGDLVYEPCVNGVCKSTVAGRCWSNTECPNGSSCVGAFVCGCGLLCDQGDAPGKCEPPSVDSGSAVRIDGSVTGGGKDASGAGGDGGRSRADAAEAGVDGADSGPVDCATSATCPSDSCEMACCPGSGECALCCLPKSCQAFDATHCPLDGCQLLPTCKGTSVCHPLFTAPPPTCGGLGYYGGHAACCPGAVPRCGLPLSDGSCDLTVGGYDGFPMCVACGDGNCDTQYENRCSCPEDCR